MMLAALATAAGAGMTTAPARAGTVSAPLPVLGTWSNPKATLAVRTAPCAAGGRLCGAIVWAGAKAVADAKEAGVTQLVGTQLLQGYRQVGAGSWSGRVFIPDMGRSFSSRIRQTRPDELTISGCLIGGLFCRSQTWRRVG